MSSTIFRIAHLSDLHFGTEIFKICDSLKTILCEIRPEITVISGDITQRARANQFTLAKEFLNLLPGQKIAIPGNHDIPLFNPISRFIFPYSNYTKAFGPRSSKLVYKNVLFLGLDATTPYLHTRGILKPEQVEVQLQELRESYPASTHLLCAIIHQPILVPHEKHKKDQLINTDNLLPIFKKFQVDLILSGHIHLPYCTTTQIDKSTSNIKNWDFIFLGAGTAVSYRTRENIPNSFYILDFDDSNNEIQITSTKYDFHTAESKFLPGTSQIFKRVIDKGWQELRDDEIRKGS
jgi:3',5'-cyclic AMP phosphodiesterase CpdA